MTDSTTTPQTKTCSKCGALLLATTEFFYSRHDSTDGLRKDCKECCRTRRRSNYGQRSAAAKNQYNHNYYMAHRNEKLARDHQRRHVSADAIREYVRSWSRINRDRIAQYKNNRKALKAGNGGSLTADDIRDQYKRQKGTCFYCHASVSGDYHVDHVVPLSLGGSNGPENIVIACPACNCSKRAKHPMDFAGILL